MRGSLSCGPGDIYTNPMHSNLVKYADPASGSLLPVSDFNHFHVYFLQLMNRSTFSVSDDIGMCKINNDEDTCIPEGDNNIATGVFNDYTWSCYAKPCDILYSDKLELSIDPSSLEDGSYLVRIKQYGVESHLRSIDDHRLEDSVDFYIRIVTTTTDNVMPYVSGTNYGIVHDLGDLESDVYIPPHEKIDFRFSERMGFIAADPNPLFGFNFKSSDVGTRTHYRSDSIQGLAPGTFHSVDFISSDIPPRGVPFSVDLHGNHLSVREDPHTPPLNPKSDHYEFQTSHVRILYPLNAPFTGEPFVWLYTGQPTITVDYSQQVSYVKCEDIQGSSTIRFNRKYVDPDHNYMVIDINKIKQLNEGQIEHSLYVHAYGQNDEYLGRDVIKVNVCPYPNIDEQPPVSEYELPESIYVELGDPSDLDSDMLNDEYEFHIAKAFGPFFVLDENEGCFFYGQACLLYYVAADTQVFWQVRPSDWTGIECRNLSGFARCAQYINIIYQFTYQLDMAPSSSGWDSHAGDTEPLRMTLRTNDNGKTWELIELVHGWHVCGGTETLSKEDLISKRRQGETPFCEDLIIPSCDSKIDFCKDYDGSEHVVIHISMIPSFFKSTRTPS